MKTLSPSPTFLSNPHKHTPTHTHSPPRTTCSLVRPAAASDAVTNEAYVLFYHRRSAAGPGGRPLRWGGIEPLEQGLPDDD